MMTFWRDLTEMAFLQYAVLAGLLASLACGVVGSYVVVRRSTYIAGAIAHCVLGGMGLARYLNEVHGLTWLTPLMGATAAALVAALIIARVTLTDRHRQDTVLSAIWAIGMAVGVSFITATPGYYEDLMSYLFGNILMVTPGDLWMMLALDVVILAATLLFYNKFLVISFHPELAVLRGVPVGVFHALLLIITALTVVLLTQVVGLIMVIALLTLPAAIASHLTARLALMMVWAAGLTLVFILGGLVISHQPEWPTGATIIQLAGATYLVVALLQKRRSRQN